MVTISKYIREMEEVRTTFKKYGYDFELLAVRELGPKHRGTIYAAKRGHLVTHYEVQILIWAAPNKFNANWHWKHPSTSQWGMYGWTCMKERRARLILEGLSKFE